MARRLSIEEAKQRAGRFCALCERSPHEVLKKICSWGLSQNEASEILNLLTSQGYVDEQRFANAFCNDKFEFNSWGKRKISMSISAHKISQVAITNALDRIDPDKYQKRISELATKKWDSLREEDDFKKKQKTAGFLANKGFEPDLIWNAINLIADKSH